MKKNIESVSLLLGSGIITWIIALYTSGLVSFVFHQRLGLPSVIVASIVTVAVVIAGSWQLTIPMATKSTTKTQAKKIPKILYGVGVVLGVGVIIIASIGLARQYRDLSFDGNAYHGEAILQLAGGWDPLYQTKSTPFEGLHTAWIDGYPKAAWVNSATLYNTTGDFRDGMGVNVMLIIASFLFLLAALLSLDQLNIINSALISLLTSANVITILQFKSMYLDGQMASLLIILFALFVFIKKSPSWLIYLNAVIVLILVVNTKLVGFPLAIIFGGYYVVYSFAKTKHWRTIVGVLTAGGVLATCVFGFNPYITNIINYKNPLYPVLGPNKIEAYQQNIPSNYLGKNNLEILALAPFIKTNDEYNPPADQASLKTPFTYEQSEFVVGMRGIGPKEGGFGPLFGGITIAAVLLLLLIGILIIGRDSETQVDPEYEIEEKKDKQIKSADLQRNMIQGETLLIVGLIVFSVIVSCLIFNNSSYARLVPQLWFIPCAILYLGLTQKQRYIHIFSYLLLAIMFVNNAACLYYNLKDYHEQDAIYEQKLAYYKELSQSEPLLVYFDYTTSIRHVFDEEGIKYTVTPDPLTCPNFGAWAALPQSPVNICKPQSVINSEGSIKY